jgi:hypothetical protein
MIDVTRLLKEADPLRDAQSSDATLSFEASQAIRRAMLAAVPERPAVFSVFSAFRAWQRPAVLAAVAALMVVLSGIAGHQVSSTGASSSAASTGILTDDAAPDGGARRQLQFATPGGTRIIWIFDENLRLQESMP